MHLDLAGELRALDALEHRRDEAVDGNDDRVGVRVDTSAALIDGGELVDVGGGELGRGDAAAGAQLLELFDARGARAASWSWSPSGAPTGRWCRRRRRRSPRSTSPRSSAKTRGCCRRRPGSRRPFGSPVGATPPTITLHALGGERVEGGGGHLRSRRRALMTPSTFSSPAALRQSATAVGLNLPSQIFAGRAGRVQGLGNTDADAVDDRDLVAERDEGELLAGEVDRVSDRRDVGPLGGGGPAGHGVFGLLDAVGAGSGGGGVGRRGGLLAGAAAGEGADQRDGQGAHCEGLGPTGTGGESGHGCGSFAVLSPRRGGDCAVRDRESGRTAMECLLQGSRQYAALQEVE